MKTLTLNLNDEADAALSELSAEQGRHKADLVADVLRKYLETERLKRLLRDPELAELYETLAEEDVALAEEGLSDYRQLLSEADRS